MTASLLSVQGLAVRYGPIEAVKGISLALRPGEITALVGANGAGKSTTLMALSGLVPKTAGQVQFDGQDITRLPPHRIVSAGVVQVAEGRATLTTLTVLENLELGAYTRRDSAADKAHDLERVFTMFPRLKERATGLAGNLSGGEQQMLAMGRALMLNPKLLLLDEPLEGLAPLIVQELLSIIQQLTEESGMAVILVEQHARQILPLTRQALVLERGRGVYQGAAQTLLDDSALLDGWLGVAAH